MLSTSLLTQEHVSQGAVSPLSFSEWAAIFYSKQFSWECEQSQSMYSDIYLFTSPNEF